MNIINMADRLNRISGIEWARIVNPSYKTVYKTLNDYSPISDDDTATKWAARSIVYIIHTWAMLTGQPNSSIIYALLTRIEEAVDVYIADVITPELGDVQLSHMIIGSIICDLAANPNLFA